MAIRKFTFDSIRTMKLFSSVCGSNPIDCFDAEGTTVFITEPGQTAKAIGKNGANIKKLQAALNHEVKVVENSESTSGLIKNYLFPIKVKEIKEENGIVYVTFPSGKDRRVVLNNNQKELKKLKFMVSRYNSKVKDIRIL